MAVRDIVRDPESGKPALVKVNYEVIEMEEFEQAYEDAKADHEKALERQADLEAELEASESRLTEAKSELDLAQTAVNDTAPGSDLDTGEDPASGQNEVAAQSTDF